MIRGRSPLYAVLDVEQDADEERVRAAYREAVKEHHPDVSDHDRAQEHFVWVTRAKSVLTDPEKRRRYDRVGHDQFCDRQGWTSSACTARAAADTYWDHADGESSEDEGDLGHDSGHHEDATGNADDGHHRDTTGRDNSHERERADTGATGGTRATTGTRTTNGTRATNGARTTHGTGSTNDTRATGGLGPRNAAEATDRGGATVGGSTATSRGRTNASGGASRQHRRTEPGRSAGRAAGAGTGSTHPDAFGGENLYYRNIARIHATRRPADRGKGVQLAQFVGVGVTLTVIFGSFALVLLYLG
jgi:curved DNA-binding protein CbpA